MNVCLSCQFSAPKPGTFCTSCGASPQETTKSDNKFIGYELGQGDQKYQVERLVSANAERELYLAKHLSSGQLHACQRLTERSITKPDNAFLTTANGAIATTHASPHFLTIHTVGFAPGFGHYTTMEYLNGTPLTSLLQPGSPLVGIHHTLAIALQACAALRVLHESGQTYNGLHPAHILMSKFQGYAGFVKLRNLGQTPPLSAITDKDPSPARIEARFPGYLAPEQLLTSQVRSERGWTLDHRVDIYAVGVLLYKLLTGAVPYRRKTGGLTNETWSEWRTAIEKSPKHPQAAVPKRPLPPAIISIVTKALQIDPKDRFQDIETLATELLNAAKQFESNRLVATPINKSKFLTTGEHAMPEPRMIEPSATPRESTTGVFPRPAQLRVKFSESGDPNADDARIDRFMIEKTVQEKESKKEPISLPPLPSTLSKEHIGEVITWREAFEGADLGHSGGVYATDEVTESFHVFGLAVTSEASTTESASPAPNIAPPSPAPPSTPKVSAPPSPIAPQAQAGAAPLMAASSPPPSPVKPGPPPAPVKPGPPPAPVKASPPPSPVKRAAAVASSPPPAPITTSAPPPPPAKAVSLPVPAAVTAPPAPSTGGFPQLSTPPAPPAKQESPAPFAPVPVASGFGGTEPIQSAPFTAPVPPATQYPSQEAMEAFDNATWNPPPKKKSPVIWLALIGLLFLGVGGYMFMGKNGTTPPESRGTKAGQKQAQTPRVGATPKAPANKVPTRLALATPRPAPRIDRVIPPPPSPTLRTPTPVPPRPFVPKRPLGAIPPIPVVRRPKPVRRRPVRRITRRRRPRRRRSGCPAPSSPSMRVLRVRSRGVSLRKVDIRIKGRAYRTGARGCLQIPASTRMVLIAYRPDVTAYHLCQVQISARRKSLRFKLVNANEVPPSNNDCSK